MIIDHNMTWFPGEGSGSGEYREMKEETQGTITAGCFHIMSNSSYSSFSEAKVAAEGIGDSYIKVVSDKFYVGIGNYTTMAVAESALASKNLNGYAIDSGTSNTIAVVKTGTNRSYTWDSYAAV